MKRLKVTHYLQDPCHCAVAASAATANYYDPKWNYEKVKEIIANFKRESSSKEKIVKGRKWNLKEKEIFTRFFRDGEVIIRLFKGGANEDGLVKIRFIRPSKVRTPTTLVVNDKATHYEIRNIIAEFPLVTGVALFDVYSGKQVPPGQKSLAYRITFQSPAQTLTDSEVDGIQQQILDRLSRELGATLRR